MRMPTIRLLFNRFLCRLRGHNFAQYETDLSTVICSYCRLIRNVVPNATILGAAAHRRRYREGSVEKIQREREGKCVGR